MLKYAAAAALAAILGSKYTSQPPPYDDGAASIIRVDARLLAGNAHGAPFPPVYKGKWALNDRLTKATRLFEGQVEGSESVATLSDGTLLTVDKYGWVWTCVEIFASSSTPSTRRLLDGVISTQVWTAPRGAPKATKRWYVGPGRPLGFHAVKDQLYVACSYDPGVIVVPWSARWRGGGVWTNTHAIAATHERTPPPTQAQGPPEARHGLGSIGGPRQFGE